MFGLYFHIPYCRSKCRYCDFYSAVCGGGVPDAYVDALCRELARFSVGAPDSVYFGGGTPSLLTPAQVGRLLAAAAPADGAEITLEANPETLTAPLLAGLRAAGVNRLSVGVQTARGESLARLGRRHTVQDSRRAFALARAAGFENISGDAMLALPYYSSAELDETLALLSEGGCTHISCYLLKIEPGSVFGVRPPKGLPDDDAAASFYLEAVEKLAALGYAQYEISNFSRPGFESRHNLIYWDCGDYLGLGPAAHSCLAGRRFSTAGTTAAFLSAAAAYEPQGVCDAADFIMLQLRLAHGLRFPELAARFGVFFSDAQRAFCRRLAQDGLAVFTPDALRLTPRGMLVQNSILVQLNI